MDTFETFIDDVAVGGAGVGHAPDGRVAFVDGAVPGEEVVVSVRTEHRKHVLGDVAEVVAPSPHRRLAPCPHVEAGCGGCGWQHVEPEHQVSLKEAMVGQALERLGKVDPSGLVSSADPLADTGYRTAVRFVVTDDGPGFRRAHDHDVVVVDSCLVAHPMIEPLIHDVDWPAGTEVSLRAAPGTGERLALVSGDRPADGGPTVPDDVRLVFQAELDAGKRSWIHDEVAGHRFRISAESFFQVRADGATALVDEVRRAVGDAADGGVLTDLYAGVGLFAATVGDPRRVVAVETAPSSAADARQNLAHRDARVVRSTVERFGARKADVVVADPSRAGLGKRGVRTIDRTAADVVVLVSCDAGSLGRDVALLGELGLRLTGVRVVDLFPQTPHVEVVSRFERSAGELVGQ